MHNVLDMDLGADGTVHLWLVNCFRSQKLEWGNNFFDIKYPKSFNNLYNISFKIYNTLHKTFSNLQSV